MAQITGLTESEAEQAIPLQEKRGKKRFTILGVEFVYLYLFGIGVAFVGWIAENTVKIVSQGIFDCRFHILPFISPYALVPFAFHVLLGDPDSIAYFGKKVFRKESTKTKIASNAICFTAICSAVFLGELAVGSLWEAAFDAQLWDYSELPLQVNRYAGLIPSLGYGGGAYLIFKFIYKPLMKRIRNRVGFGCAKAICASIGVLIVLDTLAMMIQIIVFHQPPMYWRVHLW
jgi:uncharacterized membrane protein